VRPRDRRVLGALDFVASEQAVHNCQVNPNCTLAHAQLSHDQGIRVVMMLILELPPKRAADVQISHDPTQASKSAGRRALEVVVGGKVGQSSRRPPRVMRALARTVLHRVTTVIRLQKANVPARLLQQLLAAIERGRHDPYTADLHRVFSMRGGLANRFFE
jgi:hypothetical protein